MSRVRVILAGMLMALAAATIYPGVRELRRQGDRLHHLANANRETETNLASQRQQLLAVEQDLSTAEKQLSALASSQPSTLETGDREVGTIAWIFRLRHVQQLFENHPEHRVPYLRLLTDEDWLRATLRLKFDNAMSDRNALSALRMVAARRYGTPLKRALDRYVLAAGDVVPSTASAIAPYFDDPADSVGLSQFEVVAGNNGSGWALRSTIGPDPQNYGQIVVAPTRRLP